MADTRDRFTVRVTREDGSVTYKCDRVGLVHAERERDAWLGEGYDAVVVNCANGYYREEQKKWRRAVIDGGRYFPEEEMSR